MLIDDELDVDGNDEALTFSLSDTVQLNFRENENGSLSISGRRAMSPCYHSLKKANNKLRISEDEVNDVDTEDDDIAGHQEESPNEDTQDGFRDVQESMSNIKMVGREAIRIKAGKVLPLSVS